MTSEVIIKEQVERTVAGNYTDWHIGITHDPVTRRAQLGNPLTWVHWQAHSNQVARRILQYFGQKGMGMLENPPKSKGRYIYIFLA